MGKIFRVPLLGTAVAVTQDRHGSATKAKFMNGESKFESDLKARVIFKPDYLLDDVRLTWDELFGFNSNYTPGDKSRAIMIEGTGRERAVHEYFGNRKEGKSLYARFHNRLQKAWYHALYRNNKVLDLGSGLTTNLASQAVMNDWNWPNPTTAINTLKICNFHATGTGASAAAATDIGLQTADAVSAVAGTQSNVSAGNSQKMQTVATLSGYGTEAVTEWGLFSDSVLSTTTGTPATASSATSLTATGTPFTASSSSVQGRTQHAVVDTTASPNVYGLILSNSTSVLTVLAWYKATDGTAGTTPGATDAFKIIPVMYDHKVFAAINTVSGDTIQFTYQSTIASGN